MSSQKLLVIDDDHEMRDFLQQAFEGAGLHVEAVTNAAEGLRKLLSETFHLALVDIDLPEISGLNICKALRKHERTQRLPVVMLTSTYLSPQQVEAARKDYGVSDFLFRPFTGEHLQQLLERVFSAPAQAPAADDQEQPISDYTIPQLLHRFYVAQETGLLHLQRDKAKKIVYIKDGYPIFTRSNVLDECLGRMLVKEGVITQVECDQSVESSRESGRLQGTELIDMGLLTPQEVQQALERQVTKKLLSTFAWHGGTYRFDRGKDFKQNVTRIKLSPAALILKGIERHWSGQLASSFLYPFRGDYLRQATQPLYRFQDISLNRRNKAIFNDCLGTKTVEQILDEHPLAKREVEKVLCALLISELLERHNTPTEIDPRETFVADGDDFVDDKLRRQILEDYRRIMDADYFEALGLSRGAGAGDARKAYYRLAKEYHPDRFLGRGLSNEMRAKINEMFQYITQAYTILSDPHRSGDYLEELEQGTSRSVDVNQVIEAEGAYQEGQSLLKVRRYKDAAKAFQRAIELSPEEPEYMTGFAWALFKSSGDSQETLQQATEVLLASRELNPGLDLTHLYLGHVYKAQSKERQAEKSFEMAVRSNPDCTEALRELRLIKLRREQESQSKGLFSKFIKKG